MELHDWQLNQLILFEKQNHVLERLASAVESLRDELKRAVDHETGTTQFIEPPGTRHGGT